MRAQRGQRGSAVVDIVMVMVVLVPLVLGIIQVALVMHVRNTLAAAASEGARYAATQGAAPGAGVARTRSQIDTGVSGDFARDIVVRRVVVGGVPTIEVVVRARVPALGLGGPGVDLVVAGHAVAEQP
ncbi:TadE/TadG family type IV pilus assembly protein [Nocardioides sp.]|uniref:TadE/TadG family type IV pilus assembly protein n=1 Tax=Nocardioides sp. TaxID=35761 RepID=UPI002B272F05|nr:TadE/TadG family type IV pilus assembly protein [Nocardioides sp.]